jgi:Ca-activated chloride channel family protein
MNARFWIAGLTAATLAANALASGMLIPKDGSVPPLAIKNQRVDIQIKDGTATVKVEQVFKNSVNRDLEAVYVFPLPAQASIADFAMYMGGKRVSGEIVEKDKARSIYQDIVRRMRDPGLLEHLSDNLFRASVFPVPANGEQRIEIAYSETLHFDAGTYKLVYPLKTGEQASRTLEDFTVGARLTSSVPLKNLYSPSHKVGITRKGDHEAVIGFEEDRSVLDRDFILYYSVSKADFGISLLTHGEKKDDGYFMLLLSPSVEPPKDKIVRRDVAFVFDTSGSMAGEKIKQAREALKYCIRKLDPGDRFALVRFSTDVEPFKDELLDATETNRQAALQFVESIDARGGTDINGALTRALALKKDKDRPYLVVFLTDGHPTIGVTEPKEILGNVEKVKREGTRIFVFGVGHGVNTHLLDRIASDHGGVSQYVLPDEDIEVKVSSFQDKMSHPVLTDPEVEVGKVEFHSVHPRKIGDLFAGNQITLFGRYRGNGHAAIRLTGKIGGEAREYVFEGVFPDASAENSFIPRLWATRRVGYLLEEIRLRGEDKELKDEVLRLSKEFGIMTPYTSYLILEKDDDYRAHGITRSNVAKDGPPSATPTGRLGAGGPARVPAAGGKPAEAPAIEGEWAAAADRERRREEVLALREAAKKAPDAEAGEARRKLDALGWRADGRDAFKEMDDKVATAVVPVFDRESGVVNERLSRSAEPVTPGAVPPPMSKPAPVKLFAADESKVSRAYEVVSGAEAVAQSVTIAKYKQVERLAQEVGSRVLRHVGKRLFYLVEGVWTDHKYRKGMKERKVKYASDEYFKVLEERPDLKESFALGQRVIVCLDEVNALVVETPEN